MNIIYFNPDQLRADALGCYGNALVKTPNFDRLAAQGVRYDQCHVQHTVCTPSRCSFMTGWYPHTRGHRSLWHLLRPDEPNTFRYLKEAGYNVQWCGKNDLLAPGSFASSVDDVFKYPAGYSGGAARPAKGDAHFQSFLYGPHEGDPPADFYLVQRACELIRGQKPGDAPLMLFIASLYPHPPYTCPEPWYSMYKPEDVEPPLAADLEGKPMFHQLIRQTRRLDQLNEYELRRIKAVYYGMVSYVDHLLGMLLDALDETGLAEETAVFAFSDHGDWTGDYGLVEKWSAGMDDCLTRVPMIAKSPGCKAGHVVREPIECFDVMPTTLELAGVECRHTHHARSMLPQLQGAAGDGDRAAFTEGGHDVHEPQCFEGGQNTAIGNDTDHIYAPKVRLQQAVPASAARATSMRTGTHRLTRRSTGEHELYDLANDPGELVNVYHDPKHQEVSDAMVERMLDWLMHTADVTPWEGDPRGHGA